jgi:enoyl-CoA hydratase/carnithine racemase
MGEINSYFESLKNEPSLKLLVIQAVGKAFSAGVDVGEHMGDLAPKMIETFHRMFRLMDALKVPSIAIVNGSALGGGCELALYCDMVMATEKSKFGQPEIQVGCFPSDCRPHLPTNDWTKEGDGAHSIGGDHQRPGGIELGID